MSSYETGAVSTGPAGRFSWSTRLEPAAHANARDLLPKVHWIDAFGASSRDLSGGLSNAPDPVHQRSNLPGDRGAASRRTRRVLIRGRTNRSATSTSPPNRF